MLNNISPVDFSRVYCIESRALRAMYQTPMFEILRPIQRYAFLTPKLFFAAMEMQL